MARTREQIKDLVVLNTGRSDKDTLMNSLCDSALKLAGTRHPFKDSLSMPSDFTITEDATSVDISSVSPIHIVTARIVEASGSKNAVLRMKNRTWWDENVVNSEDNQKGWPDFGMRWGTTVLLDRPAISGLELRIRISTVQTFASDSTTCPIDILDLFVEKYVTAYVFFSLQQMQSFYSWKRDALGPDYDRGVLGGELLSAIESDKYDIAEGLIVSKRSQTIKEGGVSILNQITGHGREGKTDLWF